MATEYKLSYTATDINARLGKINQLSENVADLQDNINAVQGNVE
jgi:flagellar hook-associated protein FlgK